MGKVAAGDAAQLARLFERHHRALYRYLLHMSGKPHLSEDLVQEAFLRVLKHAGTYNPRQSFTVWLFGIARNALFDSIRKRKGEQLEHDWDEIDSGEPVQEEVLSHLQDIDLLQKALGELPPRKREVLLLSRYQGMRYEEIARLQNCEVGTVKVRAYRALNELRARFHQLRGDKVNANA